VFAYLRYISVMIVGCVSLLISAIVMQNFGDGGQRDVGVAEAFFILATFTAIVVAVGVFAYLRYISAMIVGCLVWMFPIAALVLYYEDSTLKPFWLIKWVANVFLHIRMFWLITVVANVSLTVIGAIAWYRSRSLPS
jgi:hypothetical protein